MFSKTVLSSWLIAVSIAVGCSGSERNNAVVSRSASPSPQITPMVPKDGNYPGRGKVTKINLEIGSVELDHEDIPGVMPAMIMEMYVRDASQLRPLKVGDEVEFVLEYKHPTETIISIKKADQR